MYFNPKRVYAMQKKSLDFKRFLLTAFITGVFANVTSVNEKGSGIAKLSASCGLVFLLLACLYLHKLKVSPNIDIKEYYDCLDILPWAMFFGVMFASFLH
jgi:hypothetical protein